MPATEGTDRLAELRSSARGWHGVQLAVLGFIGLCGVLQGGDESPNPRWLQLVSGVLVLAALVLACTATALVATAAWPVRDYARPAAPVYATVQDDSDIRQTFRRLRAGIILTFVAVALLGVATSAAWWPDPAEAAPSDTSGLVEVGTASGVLCGALVESQPGLLTIEVAGEELTIQIGDADQIQPVDECP